MFMYAARLFAGQLFCTLDELGTAGLLLLYIVSPNKAYAVKGADVSTLTRQEADGVKYNECGTQKDITMDLACVKALAARCKAAGLQISISARFLSNYTDGSHNIELEGVSLHKLH